MYRRRLFGQLPIPRRLIPRTKRPIRESYARPVILRAEWMKEVPASCTPKELTEIIVEPSGGSYVIPTDPYNEVYPGIYIGDGTTALCTALLKKLGITHILNAAKGKNRELCLVNTSEFFYNDAKIKFLGIEAWDTISFRLSVFFEEAAEFIEDALSSNGKVYVHCRAGISRSAALVIAFLMLRRNMTAQQAVRTVRQHRNIIPNDGFLRQICQLNETLVKQRKSSHEVS